MKKQEKKQFIKATTTSVSVYALVQLFIPLLNIDFTPLFQ